MKRLLLAACLAIGAHVAFFSIQPQWTLPTQLMPQNRSVTISLVEAPPAPSPKVLPQPKKLPAPKPKPRPKPKPVKAPEPVVVTEPEPDLDPEQELEPLPEIAPADTDTKQAEATLLSEETKDVEPPGAMEGAIIQSSVPRYDINPTPNYPRVAKRRGYEGTVVLEVLVTPEGRVGQIRVGQSSGHTILDRQALATVGKWVFTPALRGSEAVEMWVDVPIEFELK